MNFHSLDYFLVLAREKNFTRAAEALHRAYNSEYDVDARIARIFNTYGIGGAPAADVARAVAELERAAEAVAAALEAARP